MHWPTSVFLCCGSFIQQCLACSPATVGWVARRLRAAGLHAEAAKYDARFVRAVRPVPLRIISVGKGSSSGAEMMAGMFFTS